MPRYFRRRSYAARDPYWLDARFASNCTCGKLIQKGDRIFYYPSSRTAVCENCGAKGQDDLDDERTFELQNPGFNTYEPNY